jgi:hypothetical protein
MLITKGNIEAFHEFVADSAVVKYLKMQGSAQNAAEVRSREARLTQLWVRLTRTGSKLRDALDA